MQITRFGLQRKKTLREKTRLALYSFQPRIQVLIRTTYPEMPSYTGPNDPRPRSSHFSQDAMTDPEE